MISWSSQKQRLVADSTCFAEYIALHESSHEAIFLRQLLDSIDFPCRHGGSTPRYCDNDVASRPVEDHVLHPQVKYTRVEFHAIRDSIDVGGVQVFRVRSADNTADILTKPLGRSDFLRLVLCMTTTLGGYVHILYTREYSTNCTLDVVPTESVLRSCLIK